MRACNYSLRIMLPRMRRLWAGGRQPFHNRPSSSGIRLDANAIIDNGIRCLQPSQSSP